MMRLLLRDRARARADLAVLLGWDFDRVVLAHGEPIAEGGREAMREAWAWL